MARFSLGFVLSLALHGAALGLTAYHGTGLALARVGPEVIPVHLAFGFAGGGNVLGPGLSALPAANAGGGSLPTAGEFFDAPSPLPALAELADPVTPNEQAPAQAIDLAAAGPVSATQAPMPALPQPEPQNPEPELAEPTPPQPDTPQPQPPEPDPPAPEPLVADTSRQNPPAPSTAEPETPPAPPAEPSPQASPPPPAVVRQAESPTVAQAENAQATGDTMQAGASASNASNGEQASGAADSSGDSGSSGDLGGASGGDYELGQAGGPGLANFVQPVYPQEARRQGLEGRVLLRVLIGADGKALDVQVLEASHNIFVSPARTSATRSTYRPLQVDGRPQQAWVRMNLAFRLN